MLRRTFLALFAALPFVRRKAEAQEHRFFVGEPVRIDPMLVPSGLSGSGAYLYCDFGIGGFEMRDCYAITSDGTRIPLGDVQPATPESTSSSRLLGE